MISSLILVGHCTRLGMAFFKITFSVFVNFFLKKILSSDSQINAYGCKNKKEQNEYDDFRIDMADKITDLYPGLKDVDRKENSRKERRADEKAQRQRKENKV